MGLWKLHSEDNYMESWLKDSLPSVCSYCGEEMENFYNDDGRCTFRRCSNKDCFGMKGHRGDFMFKLLGYKGIGPATCISLAEGLKGISHVAMLKTYEKPTMSLGTYLRIHCFEGVDSAWDSICARNSYYTLDELFNEYSGKYRSILEENKELLYSNLQYVTLKEREHLTAEKPTLCYNIMITGTPNGFSSKQDFIDKLNAAMLGKVIITHQVTKRQSDVDFLIREPGSTTKGKVEAAIKGGIPIVTSSQFINILIEDVKRINSENTQ